MSEPICRKFVADVMSRLEETGWRPYELREDTEDPHVIIKRGPATTLEIGTGYVLFPNSENPSDPKDVFGAIAGYRDRSGQCQPRTSDRFYRLDAFYVDREIVRLSSEGKLVDLDYKLFLFFLEKLEDAKLEL